MIGSGAKTLPVLDDDRVVGIVTGDSILEAVQSFLSAVTVADAYTEKLISAAPDTTIGKAPQHTSRRSDRTPPGRRRRRSSWDGEPVRHRRFHDAGGTKSQGGSPGNFGAVTAVSDTVASGA